MSQITDAIDSYVKAWEAQDTRSLADAAQNLFIAVSENPSALLDDGSFGPSPIWERGVQAELAAHLVEALSEFSDGSTPNVESAPLGGILAAWHLLGTHQVQHGRRIDGIGLFRLWLSILREAQPRLGRLHKGTPLYELGLAEIRAGAEEAAEPYLLAALVEDAVRDPAGFRATPAARLFAEFLGRPNSFFDGIVEFSEREPRVAALRPLARLDAEFLSLALSMDSGDRGRLLDISLHYDDAMPVLVSAGLQDASTDQERGAIFEFQVAYLLRTLARFASRGRVKTLDGEDDLILSDPAEAQSPLGDYLLVECKYWSSAVGASEIKKFVQNLRSASCTAGIFVAKKGVTGDELNNANYTIRSSYHRDGVIVIVLTDEDIRRLVDRKVDARDLLLWKYERIRFDEKQDLV